VPDAIELGKVAAEKMAAELSRFSIPEEDYLAWREHTSAGDAPNVQIAEVRIKGLQKVSPEYVEAQLESLKPPAEVSQEQISEDTDRIYATGDFKKVDYKLTGPPGKKTIEIFPVEKSWGPNYLRFDFGL
jgi:NTE family protein